MQFRNKKTKTILNVISESVIKSLRNNPLYEEVGAKKKNAPLPNKGNKITDMKVGDEIINISTTDIPVVTSEYKVTAENKNE